VLRLGAVVLAALVLAPSTSAGDIVIRPGIGIGKLRLGMTEAQARRSYEFPYAEREPLTFGREIVEISFGLSGFSAVLEGRRGRARVIEISTVVAHERTAQRIGVGSTERQLAKAFGRRLTCSKVTDSSLAMGVRFCGLITDVTETIFKEQIIETRPGIVQFVRKWNPDKARINEVLIRDCRPGSWAKRYCGWIRP
jgi:hypothetical protein